MTLKFSPALLLLGLTLQACSSSVAGPIEAKHYQSKHYEATRYGTHYEGASQSYGAYSLQNAQGLQGNCGVSARTAHMDANPCRASLSHTCNTA